MSIVKTMSYKTMRQWYDYFSITTDKASFIIYSYSKQKELISIIQIRWITIF